MAGHGELYVSDPSIRIEGFIMDMPSNTPIPSNYSNMNCRTINKNNYGGTESRVCAGKGNPPDYLSGAYDGDVDFFKVGGQWYKIHTGFAYPRYRWWGGIGIDTAVPPYSVVTTGLGLQAYYLISFKSIYTSDAYIAKIRELVYPWL